MAVLRDKEEEKGQGTSQALGQQVPGQAEPQMQPQQAQPSGPATIGGSSATQASPAVKTMPKQQKAGTGTFANLRSYLDAAQAGGQQRVAQAATQQVQRLGTGAQKGVQQAQETFRGQLQSGSGAVFQGEGGQALTQEQAAERAKQRAEESIGAARAVTFQAPQPQSTTPTSVNAGPVIEPTTTTAPVPKQAKAPTQQELTEAQKQQFADIINAQYQGPQSIQQAGLYEPAAQKARAAQQAAELTQTAGGREQLLRDVFGRSRDYSRGASRLDALLLNASEQGVRQLQQQATPALQAQQALQEAQNVSANEAAQRAAAIEQIRSGARQQFTQARTEEERATEKRITDLIETPAVDASGNKIQKLDSTGKPVVDAEGKPVYLTEWERLPDYFRRTLAAKSGSQLQLSPEEAAVLGVSAGEGLYNIRPDDIRTTTAERARLITKNELARQQALAQLAQADVTNQLQKELLYTDMEKAGTQDLTKSLDVESFRKLLNEAQAGFETAAKQATLTGTGEKKVSRGNLLGKKTKTYGASVEGNVADMLRQAGYDIGAEAPGGAQSLLTNRDLLNRYLEATKTSRDSEGNVGFSGLEGGAVGAGTGAAIGSAILPGPGTIAGAGVGAVLGSAAGTNTLDAPQATSDLLKEMEDKLGIKGLGATGQAIQDTREGLGNVYGETYGKFLDLVGLGSLGSGIKGVISGIDTGAMKSYGEAIAKDIAIQDLKNKYSNWLKGQGFENRANIVDTDVTKARSAALLDLLRRQG